MIRVIKFKHDHCKKFPHISCLILELFQSLVVVLTRRFRQFVNQYEYKLHKRFLNKPKQINQIPSLYNSTTQEQMTLPNHRTLFIIQVPVLCQLRGANTRRIKNKRDRYSDRQSLFSNNNYFINTN